MNLEEIQNQLINEFDFDKAVYILEKLDEDYSKEDLIENARGLIKMAYLSREMDDIIFSGAFLVVSRSYYEKEEVSYSLNFSLEISSNLTIDL